MCIFVHICTYPLYTMFQISKIQYDLILELYALNFLGPIRRYFNICPVWICKHSVYWDHAGCPRRNGAQSEISTSTSCSQSHDCGDCGVFYDGLYCRYISIKALNGYF